MFSTLFEVRGALVQQHLNGELGPSVYHDAADSLYLQSHNEAIISFAG